MGCGAAFGIQKFVKHVYSNDGCFLLELAKGGVELCGEFDDCTALQKALSSNQQIQEVCSNRYAFAVVLEGGGIVTCGGPTAGGDPTKLPEKLWNHAIRHAYTTSEASAAQGGDDDTNLQGNQGIKQVYATSEAFAALLEGGEVVTWGDAKMGGDSSSVSKLLKGSGEVVQIYSTNAAFAAVHKDGSITAWGDPQRGGQISSSARQALKTMKGLRGKSICKEIYATEEAFAAVLEGGGIVTWGHAQHGGDSSAVQKQLLGNAAEEPKQVCPTRMQDNNFFGAGNAFAVLMEGGLVVTWGDPKRGGDSSAVQEKLTGNQTVKQIYSTCGAFAAVLEGGGLVTWGWHGTGGDSAAVQDRLSSKEVISIYSNKGAFAAVLEGGELVTWGAPLSGGDSSSVQKKFNGTHEIKHIYSTDAAFAAELASGEFVTWGRPQFGGRTKLWSNHKVKQISSTKMAFAAVLEDGGLVIWGTI